ncbi:MAG: ATP-dependent helicase HrpB [Gammaproteobacteria bacterium]|nr:ATP-dependent helicase HrpB [Gammaproteobacteria bacterium]
MLNLPIDKTLPDIQKTLNRHNRVVLQAPPGAGKTTAVPIALLDQPWLQDKQIIMLEPRRLAARNAAARMAFLLGEKAGKTVGYQIRQDSCFSDKTKILVVTEGILTRKLQADPELQGIALVIFDEFHERNLHADLSLALCLQSQQIIREDLKILVMSATLNTDAISNLLSDSNKVSAPIIQSEGRSFPVDIRYVDKAIKQTERRQLISSLAKMVRHVIDNHQGNCLVFLPGVKEINQLASEIKQYLKTASIKNILVAPLHGSLNKQQQDQAIAAPVDDMRKIVLATNIAETSLTIEGINCVIDSGLERILQYAPSSGMNRLITQSISQDSAIQRSGRAGRLSAGVCYRLWTEQQQQRLLKHSLAEISHSDLSTLVLELANWGVLQTDELRWLDTPPDSAIKQAKTLLRQLDALDEKGNITQHGRNMLQLGTHPRLAHMMLSAAGLEQPYLACLIAGILTEKDLFLAGTEKSYDIHDRLDALRVTRSDKNKKHHGIDLQQCNRIVQTADDFFRRLKHSTKDLLKSDQDKNVSDDLTGVLLAFAYPDRIAKQRNQNRPDYLLSNGKGASIPPFLQHHLYEYLVIANLDAMPDKNQRRDSTIYLAAEISKQQLQDYFSESIRQTETIEWNETQQRVDVKQLTSLGKIALQEKLITPKNKDLVHQGLIQAIKNAGLQCLNWSPLASSLKQRVQFINANIENNSASKKQFIDAMLPDFSDENLLDTLSDWLQPYLKNENSLKQCQKLDIHMLLINQLSWPQQQLIEKLAPESITVPSGSSIRIDYSDPQMPVLAVRLQEVFGLYETPTILSGHCKIMMHLLSPARRPMQVTQDLNSFWQTTYHDVKKELRGKYKRHYWPDDPLTAQATSKTKKQMNR